MSNDLQNENKCKLGDTPMDNSVKFADKLWEKVLGEMSKRKEEGTLHATRLSRETGIARSLIYKYLDGSRGKSVSLKHAIALAKALGFTMSDMLSSVFNDDDLIQTVLYLCEEKPELLKQLAIIVDAGGETAEMAQAQLSFLSKSAIKDD